MVRRRKTQQRKQYKMQKFDMVIYITLLLIGIVCLFPIMYVFSVSVTPITEVYKNGGFVVIPRKVTFDAYKSIFTNSGIPRAMKVTMGVTAVGTISSLIMTVLAAYPLSIKNLPGRKYLVPIFVFTMLFSGGTIPTYLVVKSLGLTGHYSAMIIPALISTYNMLVMKSFFESLPTELAEAAKIDGAGDFSVLCRIIIPLSKPVMMTVGLFYLVSYWNTYFNALMYITKDSMQPLQIVLRRLLAASGSLQNADQVMPSTTLQMAAVIVSSIPVLIIYPFLQKYFTKGMVLGAVKG